MKITLAMGLLIASAVAFLWAAFRSQQISYSTIDSFPLQFRDELSSRYAFHYIVLAPSTPLHLQKDYVRTLIVFCFVPFGVSLSCFLLEKNLIGGILLAMFFGFAFLAGASWKTYCNNRSRQT